MCHRSQSDFIFFKENKMLKIDFTTQTAVRDGVTIIKNGVAQNDYVIPDTKITFEQLETLYDEYCHSVPDSKRYRFKALNANELELKHLTNGKNRRTASETLELTLLTGILNKSLVWKNPKHWYWQSDKYPDFVLLKAWFN